MATGLLQLPCLGRPFSLGMFYNSSQQKLISGKNLWANAVIQSKKQVSSTYEVITQDSLANKFKSLSMNDSQKLGFLAGIIEVSGSAQFLTDRVTSKDQARVTLKYSSTTHMEEVGDSDISSTQQSDTIEESATHVVTGILYGSDTFFVFDRALQNSESICDISGTLENMVRNISKSGASHEISEEESKKISCMIYGDISLLPNSLTYKEFTKIFSELPTLVEGKNFPKIAFLQPLGNESPEIHLPICSSLTAEVVDTMEWLHDAEIQCKDLKKNDHCSKFVYFNNQLSNFLLLLDRFKNEVTSEVSKLHPKLPEKSATEAELREKMSSLSQQCPFNSQGTIKFVKNKSKELKLLCQYMSNLTKDSSIQFLSSMDDSSLYELTTDLQYDHVILFVLNLSSKESNYLLQLKNHLDSTSYSTSDGQLEWFENQKALKELRHRSKQFLDFFKINKNRDNLAFAVTDQSKDIEVTSGPVMILYTNGEPQPFEPPGRPGVPQVDNAAENSIDLSWSPPEEGAQYIHSYNIFYSISSNKGVASKRFLTTTTKERVHLKDLTPDTEYTFSVEAVCDPGVSVTSEEFRARTTPPYHTTPADDLVKISDLIQDKSPMIYQLPLNPISQDPTNKLYRVEVGSSNLATRKAEKVLMVVGATGAGKSTLINALANYILGVKWEDTFRFKVITEESTQSQAHSQTKHITAYTFHHTILPYSLTIVDTPGFGDTMGIKNDKKIAKQIKRFFSNDHFNGIDCLHGIGFVTQASLARLTPTQRYIFDAVLSIFGKDIVDNIFLMTTFADANDPPVLEAVKVAKIPYKVSFKFNNSAIFSRNDSNEQFNHMFWEMGIQSLLKFFQHFSITSPQSLMMTKEVLTERERLETLIPGLETQVKVGLSRLDEIQQEERVLQQHEAEINANKNFTYQIKVNKHRKIPLQGVYTTNCLVCSFTCHDNCIYANDADKAGCRAMSSTGYCEVCPQKCYWEKHSNTPYYFEYYDEYELRTYEDLKSRYDTAQSSKNKTQSMIYTNEKILVQLQAEVYSLIDEMRFSIHRLDEIALRPNPLSDIDYIELLIESEKREHKFGWQDRIRQYERIKKDAQVLKKIPKVTKEKSNKQWWQFWL